jgi:hypothetical protein
MSRRGTEEGREEDRGRTDKWDWKDRRDGKQGTARKEIKAQNLYKKCTELFNITKTLKGLNHYKYLSKAALCVFCSKL